jgi:hypothetical protein
MMPGDSPSSDEPPHDQRHFAAVGRVASEWAEFESLIDWGSARLADINDEIATCFTAQISGSARKWNAYIALANCRGVGKREISALHKLAGETAKLAEQRNRVVHDSWFVPSSSSPVRIELTAQRTLRMKAVEVSTGAVERLIARVIGHADQFLELNDRVIKSIPLGRSSQNKMGDEQNRSVRTGGFPAGVYY